MSLKGTHYEYPQVVEQVRTEAEGLTRERLGVELTAV